MLSLSFLKFQNRRGFSLIQLMISLTLLAVIGAIAMAGLSRSNIAMVDMKLSDKAKTLEQTLQRILMDDLQQAAYLNLSCNNGMINCTDIPVQGGITLLPGVDLAQLDNLDFTAKNFRPPASFTAPVGAALGSNDAIRVAVYDFDSVDPATNALTSVSRSCPLLPSRTGFPNPLSNGDFFVDLSAQKGCKDLFRASAGGLNIGGLYVVMQPQNPGSTLPFLSTVVQVTGALEDATGVLVPLGMARLSTALTSPINQLNGIASSNLDGRARLFPIQLIEWAVDPLGNLIRRRLQGSAAGAATSIQVVSTEVMAKNIEGFQVSPKMGNVTFKATFPACGNEPDFYRSLSACLNVPAVLSGTFNGTSATRGLGGIAVRFAMRSDQAIDRRKMTMGRANAPANSQQVGVMDNPYTTAIENDGFLRYLGRFSASVSNRNVTN